MHFGGFDDDQKDENDQNDRPKSKNEIMKEIIAKSKLHKVKKKEKERFIYNLIFI